MVSVIYPPEGVDYFDLRMLIFFDIEAENVIHAPFQIKNLSLAPQSYEENSDVGTLFGARIQSTDPFAIYKESTPYLYLTKDSGVEPLEGTVEIPFNENLTSPYPINMLTAWVKPNFQNMQGSKLIEIEVDGAPGISVELFKDPGTDEIKNFTVLSPNQDIETAATIYKNGEDPLSSFIELEDNQWAFIGVEMPYPVNAGSKVGKTILHTGAVYQNVTVSKVTVRGLAAVAILRDYWDLRQELYQTWSDLARNEGWTYKELLTTESTFAYQTSPTDAFNIYSGNNGIIIGEDSELKVQDTKGTVLLNVDWKTYDRRPA